MPTTPQPPARPAPQQPPTARPTQPPPVNRPAPGVTVGPAQTYPPGSRYARDIPGEGPDPQENKLRTEELAATRLQEEPVRTIAQEQRERSEEMTEEGIERRKARLDERDPRDRPRTVAGVSPTQVAADPVNRR
jgi:hypothetical protein